MAELIETPLTVVHVISCAFLILVVLLQPGKSGGLGAFSGAAAQQVFGGRGAGNFLTKTTWVIASVFLMTSLSLAYLSSTSDDSLAELATELEDAAHANKAPEAAVKLSSKGASKPKADPNAIRKALESLTLDAGVAQQPGEISGSGEAVPANPVPVEGAEGSSDTSSPGARESKGAAGPAKSGRAPAAQPGQTIPGAPATPRPSARGPVAPQGVPGAPEPAAPQARPPAPPAQPTAPQPPVQPEAPAP